MKYAIYDKAADGYLTKMEFEVGYSENTQFECGYNEYITEAQLLDTPKEAADAIVRIEGFKFMDNGRFVMHSFDDTLKDHYIISEAGNPTKVVDNITVNIDGTIDVKYGTMTSHWSTLSLEYAINRMNALQKAKDSRYTAWCNTFDIYKVINVIDEKSSTHYQFIKVTEKGLTEYAKNEVDPLNKRIEELEKANYDLGQQSLARGLRADRLKEENDDLKTKVEATNKELLDWKKKCKAKDTDYEMLKNKLQACEVVLDSTHDLLTKTTEERDKALERAEKFKGIANSVYGITVPGRCCSKQLMADILSGKKVPISKDKYDAILTSLKLIDLSYEGMYGTMIHISPKPKPTWLPGLLSELKDLTE